MSSCPPSPLFVSPIIFKGIYQLSVQWNSEAQKCEGLGLEPKAADSRAHVLLL